jgi:putative hydrolase of the HAD superfamily
MFKAVFFDLDGTLHDRTTSVHNLAISQHQRFESLHRVSLQTYVQYFFELDERGYVSKLQTYPVLVERLGLPSELGPLLAADYWACYGEHTCGFAGMAHVLSTLRQQGFKLSIVTNGPIKTQMNKVMALNLEPLVDDVVVSEAAGVKKPDRRIFELAMERLGVSAGQSIFIGDHPENDIVGPQALGLKAIWFRDAFWGDAPTADAQTDNLLELPGLIERLMASNG